MDQFMDLITPALVALFGAIISFGLARLQAVFTAATGVAIEEKHMRALHSALKSGVEAALAQRDLGAGAAVVTAHAVKYAQQSVPDAIAALVPGNGVLDMLALRYYREAMERLGVPIPEPA